MSEIFSSTKTSPLYLVERIAKVSIDDIQQSISDTNRDNKQILLGIAHILQHYWNFEKNILEHQYEENTNKVITISRQNIKILLKKIGISITEAETGSLVSEEVLKCFEPVSIMPNTENDKIIIDKTISPAIFYKNDIFLKGTIQILKPVNTLDEMQEDYSLKDIGM